MKRCLGVVAVGLVLVATLSSQSTAPPSAGELAYRLSSPVFLGGGTHMTRTNTALAVLVNPASGAGFQRIILDANYARLQALSSDASGGGNVVNLAMAVPTRFGVFSGGFGYMDTSDFAGTAMDLGLMGRLNIAFSKEIYSDLWVGVGIDGQLGEFSSNVEGGAALNIGFLHFPKTFGGMNNFQWGIALSGLGYRYGSQDRSYWEAVPENITPAIGMAFDPISGEKFTWTLRSDVRIPSISDLWFGIASDLYFGSYMKLSISSSFDIRDAFDGSWQTLIPSASLGLNFPLGAKSSNEDDRLRTTEMDVQMAAAPLYDGVWAFAGGVTLPFGVKDLKAPEISIDYESPQYISPNYDGIRDELIIPYEVSDDRYVSSYEWTVLDSNGNLVRSYRNKDERPENETVKNFLSRLVSAKEGTALPEQFRWDGVSESGTVVEDGDYTVNLEFRDDNDNTAIAGPFAVVVDTVAPQLTLASPEGLDLIFSPDGDGYKENFRVEQSGSLEHLWEAEFRNIEAGGDGDAQRTWAWAEKSPEPVVWDGKNDLGEVVVDGVYRYLIKSEDLAGNSTEKSIEGIIVDTRQPDVGLTIDRSVFSPLTESTLDRITLKPDVPVKAGIVDWKLEIRDSSGKTVRSWTRREGVVVPDELSYDGRDSNGRRLPEGTYRGEMTVEYSNGHRPGVSSAPFVVDVTPPTAQTSVDFPLFSPQGSSQRNKVTITQQSSREETWIGRLKDESGKEVKSWVWIETASPELEWSGRDAEGRLVPDGSYRYTLESIDKAGNRGVSEAITLTVDTSAVEASVTSSLDVFGPTGNGVNDTVNFFTGARTDSPIQDWVLALNNASGNEVRRWAGNGKPGEMVTWDGRTGTGSAAADGDYVAKLTVRYAKGDVAKAQTDAVTLDTLAPNINVSISDTLFSPDNDGQKDVLNIVQDSSKDDFFYATVYDSSDRPVRTWRWKESLSSISWDGTDDSGNRLADGDYRYEVSGMDKAGNQTTRTVRGIRIDTAATPVYLTAAEGYVKAGERDPKRFQRFTAVVPNATGIQSWTFSIIDSAGRDDAGSEGEAKGRVVKTETGTKAVPGTFTWNGTDSTGKPVEGTFIGALDLVYAKGNRPRAESRPFISDGSPPVVNINLAPQPFSPDGDNVDDEVVIGLAVEDASRISEWSLVISDPRGKEFIRFSGKGRPSERIIWDGRGGRGESVESAEDYPYILTVTDVLGHTAVKRGKIAVDVLVVREGNRLKILINNITFEPNLPQLTLQGEQGEKNQRVLDRLAEIMQKYNSYRIIVQGHAVSLKWDNAAAAAREQKDILVPLSQSRAQTVVDELSARGVSRNRMSAEGIGGDKPIVPHGDIEERWRNRRVEFYLEK